jgi:hypothetical protein
VSFPLARFSFTPASCFIFSLIFSWQTEPFKRKTRGYAAPKTAAARVGGSSGGGGGYRSALAQASRWDTTRSVALDFCALTQAA